MIILDEYIDKFKLEAELINSAKCYLLKNDTLDDFSYIYASDINKDGDDYYITVYDYVFKLTVKDNMIVDYVII